MHASTDIRMVKCFDGLNVAFGLIENSYNGLHEECCNMLNKTANPIDVLSRCWSIVDNTHRVREISQSIPGLSNKNASLKKYLTKTTVAEDFRHYIQHLRRELSKKEIDPFPVWGTISWIDNHDNDLSHTAILGAQIQGTSYAGSVYDTFEKKWVSKVTLSIQNLSFNFDPVYATTQEFKQFIIPWIIDTYKPGIQLKTEIPIISAKVTLPNQALPGDAQKPARL
jgi:hypothetical protein